VNHREQPERKNPVYAIVGYLTIALLLAGATFKIMHWPGAGYLLYASVGFLLLGFVPLYVVNVFQRSGKEKASLPYLAMLLVGIACVMLIGNINISRNLIDIYLEGSLANETRVEEVQDATAALLEQPRDSTYMGQWSTITKIHDQARDLQVMLTGMQEGMIAYVGQAGSDISDVRGKDNRMAGRQAMLENGAGAAFIMEARKFAAMLDELISEEPARSEIEDHLEFTGMIWEYEHGHTGVEKSPLIKNYYKNTDASKGIALAEYVAIAYLLHK
jgi:hypothetical protein